MDNETLEKGTTLRNNMAQIKNELERLNFLQYSAAGLQLRMLSKTAKGAIRMFIEADLKSQLEATEKEFAKL